MEVRGRQAGLPWQGEACGACGSRPALKQTRHPTRQTMTVPPQQPRRSPDYDGQSRLALVSGTLIAAALLVWTTGSTSGFADLVTLAIAMSEILAQVRNSRR